MFTGTLPIPAQESLALLGKSNFLPKGTYLAGGSGLALHFGHRRSEDFDFFTPNFFDQEILAKKLSEIGKFKLEKIAKDTLMGKFNGTKLSIFCLEAKIIAPTIELWGIEVASPEDIGAMKMAAVSGRGTKKDLYDLYFLDKHGISLDRCIENYDKKYQKLANNIYSIVKGLSYFDEAEKSKMPTLLKKIPWKDIKTFFLRESLRLARKYL